MGIFSNIISVKRLKFDVESATDFNSLDFISSYSFSDERVIGVNPMYFNESANSKFALEIMFGSIGGQLYFFDSNSLFMKKYFYCRSGISFDDEKLVLSYCLDDCFFSLLDDYINRKGNLIELENKLHNLLDMDDGFKEFHVKLHY